MADGPEKGIKGATPPTSRPPLLRYGVVPLAVAAALLCRLSLWGILGAEIPFLLLCPAVLFCAWYGGLWPGLLATALAAAATAFFLFEPRWSLAVSEPSERLGLALFAVLGAAISLLTERLHRQARDLFEQRERLRVSLTSIGDAVIATDTEGRVSFLNPTAQSLTGWRGTEAHGQPLEKVFWILNEQTRQPVENSVTRVIREGFVVGLANHTLLIAKDGTERSIEESAAPIRDDTGRLSGVILVFRDAGEKRRQALALRDSEEQFRTSFELAAVGQVQIDPATGRFLRVNRKFCEIIGYAEEELKVLTVRDITHPDERERDWEEAGPMLRGESSVYTADKRYIRKDGQPVWVSVTATLVRDGGGRPVRTLGVVQDLTARKAAEAALRLSEEQFRLMVEAVKGYAIFMLDPEGRVASWNAGAERIKGYTADEIIGQHFSLFYPPEDRERGLPERGLKEAVERGRFENEGWRVRKDGSRFLADVILSPVHDAGGRLRGYAKVTRDVTERKALERQLQEHTEELERRVEERTRELEESNAALEAFGYSVSHDLRTPLRNMQSLAQALEEDYADRLDESGRDFCRRITAAARKMDTLINDLLAYSRLSRSDLPLARVDLNEVLAEVEAALAEVIQDGQAQVEVEGPLPRVVGHRPTLIQVVTNLLSNAIKFVAPGVSPKVRVWAENRGEAVRLWFADNGIGIAPEHRDRIFKVFERLHGEESYSGTGIGLAIVKKGMERTGGRAGVESEDGKGSHFWLELPKPRGGK